MKVAPTYSQPNSIKPQIHGNIVVPPIGLHRVEDKKDYAKGEYSTVKLRNIPNGPNSMTYDYQAPFVESRSPEK